MITSDIGISFLIKEEGKIIDKKTGLHKIYKDSTGFPTIGYGHLLLEGEDIIFSEGITEEEATVLLSSDLKRTEKAINENVNITLPQESFDALVSLVFNIGTGAFRKSTLLKLLNQNLIEEASDQFLVWNKSGGSVNKGLIGRRNRERELFRSGFGI